MAEASDSDSDIDFDGFDDEDVRIAEEKENDKQQELRTALNESDIEVSDIDSDDDRFANDDDDDGQASDIDPILEQLIHEWSDRLSDISLGEFTEETGVNHGLDNDARPLDYFLKFIPAEYFEEIAVETNRYADQKGPDPRWTPTNAAEVRAYVAINIIMGIRQLPRIWNYWSTDERFRDPYVSSIMTKLRFTKMNQYIHLRDTSNVPGRGQEGYDPLFKVRPLLDMISPKLKHNYKPGKNLSLDEGMIGFKGRLHFRQYMPAKPTKWGIKVWQICEADSAYCCGFQVYTGKKDGGRQHGLGYDVIWSLSEPYHNQHRHLYFDRFFSSVCLAEHLELVNTYVCGTIVANRKGLPDSIKKGKLKQKGELHQLQKGNLIATNYKDKRQITFLSTLSPPGMHPTANKPHVNVLYNQHMGGVDKFDQLSSYYPVGRPGTKWWRYIMWYIVNMAIINAYILFQKSANKEPSPPKGYDHLQFRMDVADQLKGGFTSRKHTVGRKSKNNHTCVSLQTIRHHELVKIEGRKKICRECTSQGRKTPKGRPVETTFRCRFCDIPLCRVGCFTTYHEKNMAN